MNKALAESSLSDFVRLGWQNIDPAVFVPNWHIDAIADHLEAVTRGDITRLLINIPPRHMKQLADSTPILTPTGWRQHGDIGPGDYVFGIDGRRARVLAITTKTVSDYEVVVTGGETIKCNGDHLWKVWDRWAHKWKVLDTRTIANLPVEPDRSRFFLPDAPAVEFEPEAFLPVHPYFLGCWLGDGTSVGTCISHERADAAHIAKIEALGLKVTAIWNNGGKGVQSNFGKQGVRAVLARIGVWGNKHIPHAYAVASDRSRLELLAGLIDTGGHVEQSTGRVRISTCHAGFASEIHALAVTLGLRPYVSVAPTPGYGDYRSGHPFVYQVGFQPDRAIPTAIPRKQITRFDFARRRRAILSVGMAAEPESGHCITIDRADGLYLVGRTNVVTHNSLAVSVAWPAWTWAQERIGPLSGAQVNFLFMSYAQGLSVRDGVKSRRLMQSAWYQRQWGDRFRFTSDQNTKMRFQNDRKGQRINSSVGGLATGEGGDIIVIDDPHNVVEGESEAVREGVLSWWDEAMPSRLNNPKTGAFVVIMQRIHERDLAGHILATDPSYVHLCLPARYEHDHPFVWRNDKRDTDGQLLWPARMDEKSLTRLERSLGPYAAAGQLQQRPGPRGGGMFKRADFQVVGAAPKLTKVGRAWDLAATAVKLGSSADPDWTAGVKMGVDRDGVYYVLDVVHERLGPGGVRKLILNTASQDGEGVYIRIPQDPAQSGKDQAQAYVSALAGYMVKAAPVSGDKEQRAEPLAAQVEIGNVRLLRADWNEAFLAEFASFPTGAHDDQVDAASDAFKAVSTVAPGTGLIEFYRQEAARARLGPVADLPVSDDELVAMRAPAGISGAIGLSGAFYHPGKGGLFYVRPGDVGALENSAQWTRA